MFEPLQSLTGSSIASTTASTVSNRLLAVVYSVQAWLDSIGLGGNVRYGADQKALFEEAFRRPLDWKNILDPPLPPGLAPIPPVTRLLALVVLIPILTIGLLDFAGYAVFRTLGLRKMRVRVRAGKAGRSLPKGARVLVPDPRSAMEAPLLSPGTYDAEILLKHRARSASGSGKAARELWERTGGSFARVRTSVTQDEVLNATASAGGLQPTAVTGLAQGASVAGANHTEQGRPTDSNSLPLRPEHGEEEDEGDESGRDLLGTIAQDVGVEGPLGFSDTDAESDAGDSPTASRRSSQEHERNGSSGRRPKGSFGGLKFTPMSEDPSHLGGPHSPQQTTWLAGDAQERDYYLPQAARAADLEA